MPLPGLTWPRLKEHFRKCGVFYVAGIIVCMLLTNLLYTTTRPQVPAEREVLLYLVDALSNTEPLEPLAADALAYGQTVDETLEDVHFESILYNDPELDYTSSYLLATRMAAGDGDIYFASEIAADYMMRSEAFLPLDEYLDAGWMADLGLDPVTYTSEETGETWIAALRLDTVNALAETGSFPNQGACLIVAANCTNVDTSLEVAQYVVERLLEGYDAPAESAEPTA